MQHYSWAFPFGKSVGEFVNQQQIFQIRDDSTHCRSLVYCRVNRPAILEVRYIHVCLNQGAHSSSACGVPCNSLGLATPLTS